MRNSQLNQRKAAYGKNERNPWLIPGIVGGGALATLALSAYYAEKYKHVKSKDLQKKVPNRITRINVLFWRKIGFFRYRPNPIEEWAQQLGISLE